MIITRVFDGVEYNIELTKSELMEAYDEYRCRHDTDEVRDYIYACDDDYCVDIFNAHKSDIESAITDIAEEMRYLVDEHGYGIDDAIGEAIKNLVWFSCTIPYCDDEE